MLAIYRLRLMLLLHIEFDTHTAPCRVAHGHMPVRYAMMRADAECCTPLYMLLLYRYASFTLLLRNLFEPIRHFAVAFRR